MPGNGVHGPGLRETGLRPDGTGSGSNHPRLLTRSLRNGFCVEKQQRNNNKRFACLIFDSFVVVVVVEKISVVRKI